MSGIFSDRWHLITVQFDSKVGIGDRKPRVLDARVGIGDRRNIDYPDDANDAYRFLPMVSQLWNLC